MMFELSGPVSPLSGVISNDAIVLTSRCWSNGKPSRIVGVELQRGEIADHALQAVRHRGGWPSTRCCARRIFDAATISMARVIWEMLRTDSDAAANFTWTCHARFLLAAAAFTPPRAAV